MEHLARVFAVLILIAPLFSEKKDLPELLYPKYLTVDKSCLYIVDKNRNINVYRISDFKKNLTFKAPKGVGPGEFISTPTINTDSLNIILNTTRKLGIYSKSGKYIKEEKVKYFGGIYPFGKNFISSRYHYNRDKKERLQIFYLLNSNQKRIKKLLTSKAPKMSYIISGSMNGKRGKMDILRPYTSISISDKKIAIGIPSTGFLIKIFDSRGELLNSIKKSYSPVKIDNKQKAHLISRAIENSGFNQQRWKEMLKYNDINCPPTFPPFEKICLDQNSIYIKTWKSRNNRNEFIVLGIEGKEKRRVMLPKTDFWTVKNSRFYSLHFEEEEDMWQVYTENI